MTPKECEEWRRLHRRLHPDFAAWANRQPDQPDLRIEWERIMSEVTPEEAEGVTRRLLSLELDGLDGWKFDRDWNLLAAYVRKTVMSERRKEVTFRLSVSDNRTGREERFSCVKCHDTGLCEVYSYATVKAVMSGRMDIDKDARRLRTMNVVCACIAGDSLMETARKHNGRPAWSESQRLSAYHHCLCPRGDAEKHAGSLSDWIAEKRAIENRPNYTEEFADWNDS